jgi:hypothetical protein
MTTAMSQAATRTGFQTGELIWEPAFSRTRRADSSARGE